MKKSVSIDPEVELAKIRETFAATHKSQANLSLKWRQQQLKQLYKVVANHQDEWTDALKKDLGKERVEGLAMETFQCMLEIKHQLKHVKEWMKPKHVPSPGFNIVSFNTVEQRPLLSPGVLIIGPSNYPLSLVLIPAAGSIAGGNPTLLKPSELCPASSRLMKQLVHKYMDAGAMQVMEGAVRETTVILQKGWGKVLFTGSGRVGKIVAAAAAKTLTPVVLELGGKTPVIVDENAPDLERVAHRLVWGKTLNAGQTCVGPDYLLVHAKHTQKLCENLILSVRQQFGATSEKIKSSELGRIVQVGHAKRLVELIRECERAEKHGCTVIIGGSKLCNAEERYVTPTLIMNAPMDSRVMTEEIFGPILPIKEFETRQEAMDIVNSMSGTPLAMYVYTKSQRIFRQFVDACPAASYMRNDCVAHFGNAHLPIGGLGSSGHGHYHGRSSFDTFTHTCISVYRPLGFGFEFFFLRYHPFGTGFKGWLLGSVIMHVPEIPVLRWLWWTLFLGACVCAAFLLDLVSLVVVRNGLATGLEMAVTWLRVPP
uniref:Aldehyde dehydrogenase n=1 Tax=Grammatophora oceanica TaxID=210454 RepID=A0A7S1V7C7_9STRA|eukprot:CAMPEP_0194070614 /NCGR_PEP_ID=MMETSP0009_2-20130614/88273_1 /TAXON_ID=210454 /ORGANISM="Grammatophora oceanica, Strain CCMP 410" /LENGTH=540 /DNA_ID=CAMNT_0038723895 /DNA_START=9 /DNA_END=1631 /DNA_ORIENTATION=-